MKAKKIWDKFPVKKKRRLLYDIDVRVERELDIDGISLED
jgi:hypothetical protein